MWSSPAERARQLKAQQRILREQEWNARPEYEKRRQVLSIDLAGGKVVRKMAPVERPRDIDYQDGDGEDEEEVGEPEGILVETNGNADRRHGKGTFSQNPLLGALIKPVYDSGKGKEVAKSGEGERRKKTWRRVQDDYEDNEEVILDGGIYGGERSQREVGDEPGRG
jgi:hypothetical protein